MSKVSVCVGPPVIHKRMQCRRRLGSLAAARASEGNQPDMLQPARPRPKARNASRRETTFMVHLSWDGRCGPSRQTSRPCESPSSGELGYLKPLAALVVSLFCQRYLGVAQDLIERFLRRVGDQKTTLFLASGVHRNGKTFEANHEIGNAALVGHADAVPRIEAP